MVEGPAGGRVLEDFAEELLGLAAGEEVLLIGRFFVGVAGGDHQAVDAQVGEAVEHLADAFGVRADEEGGVGGDAEAALLGGLDRVDRDVPDAVAADGIVVILFESVDVDREGEVGAGLELVEALFEQDGVGAEVDELPALDEAADDVADLLVDQGFAAGDGDDGGAAFLGGGPALLGREAAAEDVVRVLDFAAAGAFEVALEQGFEHEHERVALDPAQALGHDVLAHGERLADAAHAASPASAADSRILVQCALVIGQGDGNPASRRRRPMSRPAPLPTLPRP